MLRFCKKEIVNNKIHKIWWDCTIKFQTLINFVYFIAIQNFIRIGQILFHGLQFLLSLSLFLIKIIFSNLKTVYSLKSGIKSCEFKIAKMVELYIFTLVDSSIQSKSSSMPENAFLRYWVISKSCFLSSGLKYVLTYMLEAAPAKE